MRRLFGLFGAVAFAACAFGGEAVPADRLANYGDILCVWLDGEWDHDPNDGNSKGLDC